MSSNELLCQGNIGHKMWGVAPMIVEGMYPGARTIGRANRFSAISPIKNTFSGVIQATLSCTPLFHDAL